MNLAEKRKLGSTAVEVPVLGFGGSTIGNIERARIIPESDALAAIETAWAAGIRYFDTAPLYGAGLGEHRIGQVLRRHPRESYVLSTKVGMVLAPLPPGASDGGQFRERLPFEVVFDYGYAGVMRSIEHSMQRLGVHRFDIVLIHDIDVFTHGVEGQRRRFREAMDGAYPALARLRREGVVKAIGVGVNSWEVCQDCALAGDFDCFILAGRYTLLEQEALGSFLPLCERRRIGVILAAPYNSGILIYGAVAGAHYDYRPAPPAVVAKVRRLEAVCRRHRVSLGTAALQFPLAHPAIASVLFGPRNPAQVEETVRRFGETIPGDLWRELKHEGLLAAEAPTPNG